MNERSIFMEALEFRDLQERAEYLRRACGGDERLWERVEALLRSHRSEGSFVLDRMPAVDLAVTADLPPTEEHPGTVIGPYKLLEPIGEGGMGVVYMAEQTKPVRRKVALKIIKPGMDTRQVIARFEAERQALALMDHPNIARVLDAGATESGRPYFVMELVKGIPITDYCDRNRLAIEDRLELFVLVCQAVQHAHQRGIIHRDLKPSNVLVTMIDGAAVPKVIDFGVAKAVQQLTEKTLFTGFAQLIGTPLYMSPEQAEFSGVDVDTRSDIYALGVLLYELLTGTTPFDADTFRTAAYDEIRRIIREEEPPKPSTRVSTLEATAVSANRQTNPRTLGKLMRGELDWIVMTALEKDRNRRYETANGLAADVRRYLDDEPVQACPPSAWYRFGKLARRHRAALITVGLVGLALVAGTAVSTWQAIRAVKAERKTAAALDVAEDRARRARQAVGWMYSEVADKWMNQTARLEPWQRDYMEKTLTVFEEFVREQGTGPEARRETAQTYKDMGNIQYFLGMTGKAEQSYHRSFDLWQALAANFPAVPEYRDGMARSTFGLSNLQSMPEKEQTLRLALAQWEKLAADFPDRPEALREQLGCNYSLAGVLVDAGRLDEAERAIRRCIEIAKDEPWADVLNVLGIILWKAGRLPEAEQALRRAAAQFKGGLDAGRYYARMTQANVRHNLGEVLEASGRTHEAEAEFRRSLYVTEKFAAKFPNIPISRKNLVNAPSSLAKLLVKLGRFQEAAEVYHQAIKVLEAIPAESLTRDDYELQNELAWILATSDVPQLRAPARAVKLARKVVEEAPNQRHFQNTLGVALYRAGDWKAAIEALGKSMQFGKGGDSSDWFFLAMAYWQLGHQDQARIWYDRAVAWMDRNGTTDDELRRFRAEASALLGVPELPADVFARP